MKYRIVSLIGVLLAMSASASVAQRTYRPKSGTEILWDTYGVPHVYGRDSRSMFYAFGWAQMHSHGDLILRLYGQARGRAAEYWGPQFIESDRWVRIHGVPERAERHYKMVGQEFRGYLDAFVAGMNAYAEQHRRELDPNLTLVLPLRTTDVIAHTQRVLHLTFVVNNSRIPPVADAWRRGGSNAWAIAPQRSASGNALLLANPHLPWEDLFTWYEAQLTSPDISGYGAALVGFPLVSIAFNDRLGWTHTNNTIDGADLYELTLAGHGYRYEGTTRPFEVSRQVMAVREGTTWRNDTLVVMRSIHGPVIAQSGSRALALRIAGLDQPHLLEQNWRMLRAQNLRQFEAALRALQLPMFTVMYADRDGHIMHVSNGRVPVRPEGDWAFWNRVVRGDAAKLVWTRTHPYGDLPRVVDPPSGWLQNANEPPWYTTLPLLLDPEKFPPYMAPRTPLGFRPQRSIRMISSDSSVTFDELIAYKHSTRLELADHLVDDLVTAARRHGSQRARDAADVLERWDRSADADSRGAILFAEFMDLANRINWPGNSVFAVRWSINRPLATPDGLSDAQQAAVVLDSAAQRVARRYGAIEVAWGTVHRLRRDTVDLPANGGPGSLGLFRNVGYDSIGNRMVATSGDSYVAAIEFGRTVRAHTLISYGNASQKGSPHRTDQLPLFARKMLKPALLTRDEVLRNLESRTRF